MGCNGWNHPPALRKIIRLMLRSSLEVLALFALPFIAYFLFIMVRGRPVEALAADHSAQMPRLILAGILCAVLGVLLLGFFEDRKLGAYAPAEFKDGKLIPGQLR